MNTDFLWKNRVIAFYQKAFEIALRENGFVVEEQKSIQVYFHGQVVGEYIWVM